MLSACVTQEPGVYRGGVLVKPGPLDVQDQYSFRFLDKWRISHRWLSGPTEIWPCRYPSNSFRRLGGYGQLEIERNPPFIEQSGILYSVSEHNGRWSLSRWPEWVYGTTPDGKFQGYTAFCGHVFRDTYDGIGLYIVKPDPAKGTDEWISGAQSVVINGLTWLRKTEPIKDWTGSVGRLASPVETWVLKIPDTPYWLKLHLSSNSGATSPYKKGALNLPEKHQRIVELFHQLVHSVTLEPITPVDITPLLQVKP